MNWSWKPARLAVLSLAAVLTIGMARADTTDPTKSYQDILQWRTQQIKDAQAQKKTIDFAAVVKESTARAKAAVDGVNASKVEPAKGLDWAHLYQLAQDPKSVIAATERFLTTEPTGAVKYTAQMLEVSSYAQERDGAGLNRVLLAVAPPDKIAAANLATAAGSYSGTIAAKIGPQAALDLLKSVEAKIHWADYTTAQEINISDSAAARLAMARAEIFTSQGKAAEALVALEDGKKHMAPSSRYVRQIDMQITASKLVGSTAPAIVRDRGYGDFPGLDACKGKVVLIDFMAHWCGPCKASLPSMKKLYNDYHSRGLEIVSVTSFYGFFANEKKLTPDEEFARMDGFIKDEGMVWPVAFGPRANLDNYGVSGIPNFILIDKDGKVNSVTVGYSPALFATMRKSVEGLLGVKSAAN